MSFPYDFHPKAEKELFEAINFLEEQREGYGALLAEATANLLDQIINNPKQFPNTIQADQRRRAALFKPFHKTYSIYFDFNGSEVVIISFFNNRRDPSEWQDRD